MKKKILQTVLFLGIMFLTFYTLLHGQNLSEIYQAVKNMSVPYLIAAAGLALFFVCAEGRMIWYLLTSMRKKQTVRQLFSVLLEKKRYVLCGVVSNIRLLDFFIRASHRPQQVGSRCSFII